MTGDIKIVENKQLQEYFKSGTKYRTNQNSDPDKITKSVIDDLKHVTEIMIQKGLINVNESDTLIKDWEEKIRCRAVGKTMNERQQPQEEDQTLRIELKKLWKDYVITPTDKVPGNYSITCKKFYLESISQECGIKFDNGVLEFQGNDNYTPSADERETLLQKHDDILRRYDIQIKTNALPIIFATPKMHKNKPSFRFIVAAKNASIKPLEEVTKNILKFYTMHFENYCYAIERNSERKFNVSINNSMKVSNEVRYMLDIRTMYTGDFTALYPSLKHATIITHISAMIDMLHKNAGKDEINMQKKKITYGNNNGKGQTFHKNEVKEMCSDILNHSYMEFANVQFKASKGTPLGGSASCQLADLTLRWNEYIYFRQHPLEKNQIIYRYVDDILAINYDMESKWREIYPSELCLNKTCADTNKVDFLDLTLEIKFQRINIKLYNKIDDFTFNVVRYCTVNSNMPNNMKIGILKGQVIRFLRLLTVETSYWARLKELENCFVENGFNRQYTRRIITTTMFKWELETQQITKIYNRKELKKKINQRLG